MTGSLPDFIDPLEFVDKRKRIRGSLPLNRMERLKGVILNPEGKVTLDLSFGREDRYPVISGSVQAGLLLACQCCLESMEWPVSSDLRLGVVSSIDEGNRLPDSLEPLLRERDDQLVSLLELVEDELLLAIPPIPQHTRCVSTGGHRRDASGSSFAVLAELRLKP
jgi:uncharacterized protein